MSEIDLDYEWERRRAIVWIEQIIKKHEMNQPNPERLEKLIARRIEHNKESDEFWQKYWEEIKAKDEKERLRREGEKK